MLALLFSYYGEEEPPDPFVPPVVVRPPNRLPRVASYRPTIVWGTGTGVDTSPYDDVSGYYLNQPGLTLDGIGRDQVRAYAPPVAPAFDLTLTNWTQRFSPGGPIGSFVGRGPRTYLDLTWGDDPGCNSPLAMANDDGVFANGIETFRLFDGTVNTAEHVLTKPERSVQIRALGQLQLLVAKQPRTTQLYQSIRTDLAIGVLLDLCGWPADKRVLDSGDTVLTSWWLDGNQDGLSALNAILGAEGAGACAYEQAGVFHFEGREFRQLNPRSLEPQWIFSDGVLPNPGANAPDVLANDTNVLANGMTETLILTDVNPSQYASNPDEVVSAVTATVNQRSPTTVQKIWELGGPLTVPTGPDGVVTEALLSVPYHSALTPVNAADVAPTAVSDFTVSSGTLTSVTLLESSGIRVRIRWVATTGATIIGTTSNGPQLRAVSLPVISQVIVRSTVSTAQQAPRYNARELNLDAWPEVTANQMLDIVNSMVLRYRQERRQATIRVANLDADHMGMILHARISDRIRWFQKHGVIDDPYWIEQIHHEISPGGGLHIMTLGCERVFETVGGRFDSAKWGLDENNGTDVFGD